MHLHLHLHLHLAEQCVDRPSAAVSLLDLSWNDLSARSRNADASDPDVGGVLFPFTGGLLWPMIEALAMSLSAASVISDAPRLRGARLDPD